MALTPGARLGPYEILALLGEGGMGAVYRAHDARLGRDVAIKVLREDVMGDGDRRARFILEAKAASALNHPNIVTVHDIGSEGDVVYMVMELVDGRPLDSLIAAGGHFSLAEVLRVGVQIADACAAAHARQIIHRDLKPANVMLQADGRAKVLDFGLAKIIESAALEKSVTQTAAGTVLGTAAYMSPEQAEGKLLDARSDIFSLGALLYELSTGKRAFPGESHASVIAALLKEEPESPELVRADMPGELSRVIMRCLRKDPARRVQSMADLRAALEELKDDLTSGKLASGAVTTAAHRAQPAPSGTAITGWRFAAIGAGVVIVALAGLLAWQMSGSRTEPPQADVQLQPVPLTSFAGSERAGTFSPDGSQIAFYWNGESQDNADIYIKVIGPGTPLRLTTDPAADTDPRWSPDGRQIAFLRTSDSKTFAVMLIPPLGGNERKLADIYPRIAIMPMVDLTWTADSKYLFVAGSLTQGDPSHILRISVDSGEVKTAVAAAPSSDGYFSLDLSPDGKRLASVRDYQGTEEIELFDVSPSNDLTGATRVPNAEARPQRVRWTGDSKDLIFQPSVNNPMPLFRLSLETNTATSLAWMGPGASSPVISRPANRLVFTRDFRDTNIWRIDLNASGSKPAMDTIAVSSFREVAPNYSPDGKRLAFHSNRGGSVQIWTANADGSNAVQLTSMDPQATTGTPRWSPDSRQLVFDSNAGGYHLYVVAADGGQPRALTTGSSRNFTGWWSPDGKWIYFTSDRGGQLDIWRMRTDGSAPEVVTHGRAEAPSISPDGQWLYFTKEEGVQGLWRMPIGGGPETLVVEALFRYNYAVTNRGVYYAATPSPKDQTSTVRFRDLASGRTSDIAPIDRRVDLGLAVSPDGRYLLFTKIDYLGADLMLVEKFR
jgi:serine/threonine protein kinase/Tol biopolymer transport system component